MPYTSTKIKEVFVPFFVVAVATILLYNIIRWVLDFQSGILPLKEDLLNFWLPIFLPWIPILIWLRRRVRLLKVAGKSDSGYFGYQFVMAFAIGIPIIFSQEYLEKAAFGLNEVKSVADIVPFKHEKYFKVDSFAVDYKGALSNVTARTSGRYDEHLTYYLYFACPFETDTLHQIWYGVKYSKTISNRLSEADKEIEYKSFIENSLKTFENEPANHVSYFEKIGYSDDRDQYSETLTKETPAPIKSDQIFIIPKTEDFNQRSGNALPWFFATFGIGLLVLLCMIIIPALDEEEYKLFKSGKQSNDPDTGELFQFLNPFGSFRATAILLDINILVFIVMVLTGMSLVSPTPKELLEIGANRRFEVEHGEYWRLLTSMFIHSGAMHLLMNLIGIGIGAGLLEGILKPVWLFVIYIICGVLASIASIYYHDDTISVGASGAIFGLFGVMLAFNLFKVFSDDMKNTIWALLGLYGGVSLLFGLFGGIDNSAHLGGLLSGFLIGTTLVFVNKKALIKNAA